jgi:hypothetical protein
LVDIIKSGPEEIQMVGADARDRVRAQARGNHLRLRNLDHVSRGGKIQIAGDRLLDRLVERDYCRPLRVSAAAYRQYEQSTQALDDLTAH